MVLALGMNFALPAVLALERHNDIRIRFNAVSAREQITARKTFLVTQTANQITAQFFTARPTSFYATLYGPFNAKTWQNYFNTSAKDLAHSSSPLQDCNFNTRKQTTQYRPSRVYYRLSQNDSI